MSPKLYVIWNRLKNDVTLRQDMILESTGSIGAKRLANQIISDRWEVHSVELMNED